MSIWRRLAFGLLLLTLLLAPISLGEDEGFLRAYKEGLEAIESRQWDLAAQKMRKALEGRSEEKNRLIKKGYLRPYLPHHYLAVALFQLGDCEGALASWTESERQGVVTRRKHYEELKRSREQCAAQVGPTDPIAPPETRVAEKEPEVAPGAARDQPRESRTKTRPPRPPGRQESSDGNVARELDRLIPEVERLLVDLDQGESQPPEIQALQVELVGLKEQTEQQARAARGPELERLLADLERSYESLRRAVDRPPAELDLAANALLDGDYPRVLQILAEFAPEEKRAEAHAHLLRSAALFASYRIRDEAELMTRARDEARAALAAEPELIPSERFFSPRFRELFQTLDGSDRED